MTVRLRIPTSVSAVLARGVLLAIVMALATCVAVIGALTQ